MASQPNSLQLTDWLCEEGVRLLTNALEVAPAFDTSFQGNLEKEFPVGQTFRVPLPNLGTIRRNTLAYDPKPIQDRYVSISCDRIAGWDVEWDSVELALSMPRSEERIKRKVLRPAMMQIKQEIDSQAAEFATLNTPNIVGTLGTNPTTFDTVYGAADQRLTELAGGSSEKTMILAPSLARALRNGAISYFNPTDEISKMFKKGYIGEVTGFGQTYQSMSLYTSTASVWAGTVEMLAGSQTGASLSLTATTGDTFIPGNVFNIAGVFDVNPMTLRSTGTLKQFVIMGASTVTAAASAATVTVYPAIVGPGSPYQNVDALPAAGADLTLFPGTTTPSTGPKSGTNSLAIGKEAFALVSIKLQNPKASSAEIVSQAQDPETGISVAFVRMFDPVSRKWVNRFDCCFGFGVLWADHCAVRILGA